MSMYRILSLTILAVLLLPVLASVLDSFQSSDGTWTWETYRGLLPNSDNVTLLKNSIVLGLWTAFLSTVLGVLFALVAGRTNVVPWRMLLMLVSLPLFFPPYLHAVAWIHLIGPGGFMARTLGSEGSLGFVGLVYGLPGATTCLTLAYFPVSALCALACLLLADPRLEEEARLHTGPLRVLLRVSLPSATPGILTGFILVFLLAVVDFGVPDQLFYRVYPTEIFARFSAFYDSKGATALAMPSLIFCLGLIAAWRPWLFRQVFQFPGRQEPFAPPVRVKGAWRWILRGILIFPLAVILFPVIVFLLKASGTPLAETFRSVNDELVQSLFIALVSATLCVTVAVLGMGRSVSRMTIMGTALLFVLPAPFLGISLIVFWNRPGILGVLYGTNALLILGMVSRFLFVAVLLWIAARRMLDRQLLEQAEVDGAGPLRTLVYVKIPLLFPSLAVAWMICFAFVLGEVGVSVLLVPPGGATLAVRIQTLMHYGPEPMLAGTAFILVACLLIPALAAAGLVQWLVKERSI